MRLEIDGVLFEINYRRLGPTARMVLRDIEAESRLAIAAEEDHPNGDDMIVMAKGAE